MSDPTPETRRGPLLDLLGIRPTVVAPGHVRVEYVVSEAHLRSGGILHGGLVATLMDTALGVSASSKSPPGLDVVTAQLNVNFLRPAWPGDRLEAEAFVRHSGRKTAVATGEIKAEGGALVATGSATFVYVARADFAKSGPESPPG